MGGMKDLLGDRLPYGGHPPYQKKSETSREAADSVAGIAPSVREQVFECIKMAGRAGRTNSEIVADEGLLLQSVCGRVAELREAGRVRDSGEKRLTPTGRRATVWIAI